MYLRIINVEGVGRDMPWGEVDVHFWMVGIVHCFGGYNESGVVSDMGWALAYFS